ncbi:DNA polymerase III subunit beta [Sphingobium limneticum]|uniref:DNA polymerase III subunit beta n=1 Tax=Sphingobium limneticum TaxID=1007511 RepID=UPI003D0207CE
MMKVQVKVLRAALKAAKAVVEKRNTIPILANVVIRSTPGQATLIATDMELMVEKVIDLENPGSNQAMDFSVHAETLQLIATKLPVDGVATIEADGNAGVIVKCGRARFKLPTLPTADFPMIPTGDWDAEWEQDANQLTKMIESVRFAISTEETRYYLNGIYLHVPDASDCQFAAATDGNRLARFHAPTPDGAEGMPGVILPRKAVKTLVDLMEDEGGTIGVSISDKRFQFELGATILTGKTIDGTFPDYTRVIPAANTIDAWFDPGVLSEAVDRVLTISSDKSKLIAMDFADEKVTLRVASPEHGTASEEVPIELKGAALTIGFNGRFLLDVLGQLKAGTGDGGKARVLMADGAAPTLWQLSDEAQSMFVLMPMRV